MKNSIKDIGKKIKTVRLEKKMTQNDLCGTEITRNHLSLIESGKSLPSLGTLCYLAERLDIPVGYFFSDDEKTEAKFANLFAIDDIKQAFAVRDYSRCVQLCEKLPKTFRGDEISLLLAKSRLALALVSAEKLDISSATLHIRAAASAAQHTCYLSEDFLEATSYYEQLFSNLTRREISMRLTDINEASSYVPAELIMYMKMLSNDKFDFSDVIFTSARHRQHANALKAKRRGDLESAFTMLKELSEFTSLPYYMKYHVYSDLEYCAHSIGEFKTAYAAAKRKMDMMNI